MGVFERAPPALRIDLAEEPKFVGGGLTIVPAERAICHGSEREVLQPRVMKVLVALAKASPAVVSRDRLVDQCWEGRIVGDDALNRCVLALRQLAQKIHPQPFSIETVPRVGHRLLHGDERSQPSTPVNRRGLLVAGGSVAVIAVAGLGWQWRQGLPSDAQTLMDDAKSAMLDETVDHLGNAAAKLKRAAELAPDSAEVWGLLALAYGKQVRFAADREHDLLVSRARASARQALALDRDQPDARAAIILTMPEFRNWLSYEGECRSAWSRHSRHAELNILLAKLLAQVGRSGEALRHLQVALNQQRMRPRLHVFRTNLLWSLGRLEEAETEIERSFELWPRNSSIWFTRFYFLMHNGRSELAAAMFADIANRPIGIPDWNFELAALQAHALEGGAAIIDKALAASISAARQGTGFAQNTIIFLSAINALDAAYETLNALYFGTGFSVGKTYFTQQQGVYWNSQHRDTYFLFWKPMANVREDSRFRQLMHGLGLDDYWRRSGTGPDYRT